MNIHKKERDRPNFQENLIPVNSHIQQLPVVK